MANSFNFSESMSAIFDKLENFLKTKTVVGEPIKIGDVTLVPFINMSFGLGLGVGNGTDEKGMGGEGGGGGTGARISPTAVLVINGDKVELLPIKKSGGLDKLIDMVPGIVEKVQDKKEEENSKKELKEE
ncbi:Sporulation protein YtfJ [Ruminiclostridium papyrosolvens DSM 2782]|uniref:Sporulation protein YtfJ n=1 Tax=Ruminiclostridium papyrosolvens DSM 2782 TaxID=588581 RepID=F1TE18_9FIRM|nr:spore germination protein GerW family protein [Ruminiclostridium papyrosolvens]EGD47464.1 Sporulation protein YtfJ [Ruminiclostridium papyrosolvens DSM 2782]WES34809.1 spore germination protein GerW family protein [Ruminiclostridium papyrosolvens DSM 2782]